MPRAWANRALLGGVVAGIGARLSWPFSGGVYAMRTETGVPFGSSCSTLRRRWATTDRNVYVKSIVFDGVARPELATTLTNNGAVNLPAAGNLVGWDTRDGKRVRSRRE